MKSITLDHIEDLDKISKLISKSRRILTLTGAGISCNAGIPDFRSSTGLYQRVKNENFNRIVKGQDLFDISLFRHDFTIEIFCKFMESLYSKTILAQPTETHKFISYLNKHKKLIKCYTQNIDGLERQCDLLTGIESKNWKDLDVVQLHGDLNKLSCTTCFQTFEWDNENKAILRDGELPECPTCLVKNSERVQQGKRSSTSSIGFLRPNIVLYGECHPYAEIIADGLNKDINKNPNILLIFGTSLRVDGVKNLVRQAAKKIHEKEDGIVIFINNCEVSTSSWDNIIDYQIVTDCDKWVQYLQTKLPNLFQEPVAKQKTKKTTTKKKIVSSNNTTTATNTCDESLYFTPPTTPTKNFKPGDILSDLDDDENKENIDNTNTNERKSSPKRNLKELLSYEIPSPEFSPVHEFAPLELENIQNGNPIPIVYKDATKTKNGKIPRRVKKSTTSSTTVSNVKRKPLSNITSKTKNSIIDSKSNSKIAKTKIEKLTDLNNNNRRLRRIRVGLSNPVPSLKRARTA
ncbi:hypothetical protein BVG19_g3544 [[Candida] boidinii]|nr:hypothetical protein BVG19_g3544 [[Candida] boidinii]OWB48939.1 hypothetical protein B5S27_g477 [[Candida] boidinii]